MSKELVETLTLKPSEFAVAVRALIPTRRAVFGWGPPGIAKSAVSQQVATGLGVAFIDVRLSQMDPTDLRGIPFPIEENGVHGVQWSAPLALPRDLDFHATRSTTFAEPVRLSFANLNPKGSNGIRVVREPTITATRVGRENDGAVVRILSQSDHHCEAACFVGNTMVPGAVAFHVTGEARAIVGFEEFNSAPPSVQAASYQLILDRRLGDYVVPDGCYLMAMGNRETDKGVTFKMAPPIMNRFIHIEMRVDFGDWQGWALNSRIHPEVVGYLSAFKEKLFSFDPGTAARGFQTPRTWEFVSDIISKNEYLPEKIEGALIMGAVGEGAGAEFNAYRKNVQDLPRAEDILDGTLKKLTKPCEVHLAYALVTTLCYELLERSNEVKRKAGENWKKSPERTTWLHQADNFLAFMMNNFDGKNGNATSELCVVGARAAIRIHKLPFETRTMKNFDVFANRYQDVIVS